MPVTRLGLSDDSLRVLPKQAQAGGPGRGSLSRARPGPGPIVTRDSVTGRGTQLTASDSSLASA